MKKVFTTPRKDWQQKCEDSEFFFHSIDEKYWIEDYAMEFSYKEIMALEQAGNELHSMCLELASEVIKNGDYDKYNIFPHIAKEIENSWKRKDFNLYGRFDISYDGIQPPKLLEYNADTPTSLLESSLIQKEWFNEQFPQYGHFNNIHENLVSRWKQGLKENSINSKIYFSNDERSSEEWANVNYLIKTAIEAELSIEYVELQNIKFNIKNNYFIKGEEEIIPTLFKLYPWEFIIEDSIYPYIPECNTKIIEPMWKMLLSTKAILPLLWEKYPNHPNLLPAFFNEDKMKSMSIDYVKKPFLSREGENIFIYENNEVIENQYGSYGKEGFVYQARKDVIKFDNRYSMIGVWMINNKASGLGIREDKSIITQSTCWFLPHYFKD